LRSFSPKAFFRPFGRASGFVRGAEPVEAPPNAPLIVPNHKVRVRPVRWKIVWQKPEPGWVKVNTYASFVLATHSGSGGVVTRDE
jgi:hypothetical protein